MAGKKQLPPVRLVGPEDHPEPKSESRLEKMRAQRAVLDSHIYNENTLARDLAPLIRQAREMDKEIESLEEIEAEQVAEGEDAFNGASESEWRPQAI